MPKLTKFHLSLILTIVATLLQMASLFLPCWLSWKASFTEDVQMGVWYICIGWKNCKQYSTLKFEELVPFTKHIPEVFIDLMKQFMIAPMLLIMAEFTGMGVLVSTVILGFVTLRLKQLKSRIRRMKVLVALNMASCFIIIAGVLSSVSLVGDHRIINALGSLLSLFKLKFSLNYGYSFYLAVAAAFFSLFSAVVLICYNEMSSKGDRHSCKRRRTCSCQEDCEEDRISYKHRRRQDSTTTLDTSTTTGDISTITGDTSTITGDISRRNSTSTCTCRKSRHNSTSTRRQSTCMVCDNNRKNMCRQHSTTRDISIYRQNSTACTCDLNGNNLNRESSRNRNTSRQIPAILSVEDLLPNEKTSREESHIDLLP